MQLLQLVYVFLVHGLNTQPDRVAIYGWHYPSGQPIQPLSLVHEADYVDYSHGARLISRIAIVDGERVFYEADLSVDLELRVLYVLEESAE